MSYQLDAATFRAALETAAGGSLSRLAQMAGVHRNTIHYYLSGHAVISNGLERILDVVGLSLPQALVRQGSGRLGLNDDVARLIDALQGQHPAMATVLFGSRARHTAQRYADYDLGLFSREGLPHPIYRQLRVHKTELEQTLPVFVDLVNLNQAHLAFLRQIANDWVFVGGRQQDWIALNARVSG